MDNKKEPFYFFLNLVSKNWKKLLALYFFVGTITVIVLILLPTWYRSTATVAILEDSRAGGLTSALANVIPFNIGGLGGASTDRYMQFTRTQKLYDRVIAKFNLAEEYNSKFREDAYDSFRGNLYVHDNDNETFNISFTYKQDPVKAYEITEYIFVVLNEIALEVDRAQAANFREYLEMYLSLQLEQMEEARNRMISFQNETGIFEIEKQIEATINSLANLEVMRVELEMQIEYLRDVTTSSNVELVSLERSLSILQDQISSLKQAQQFPLLSLDGLPERAAEFLELKRDLIIGEKVTEFVRIQFEEALIKEQQITSNLYLLDPPQIPERKFKPKRLMILVIVMFFTGLMSLLYIRLEHYYIENKESIKQALLE